MSRPNHPLSRFDNAIEEIDACLDQLESFVDNIPDVMGSIEQECELSDLLVAYYRLSDRYQRLDTLRKALYKTQDKYNKNIVPQKMFDADVSKVSVDSIGVTFYPLTKYSASVIDKENGFDWLRENNLDSLITETVNAQTLASTFKDMLLNQGIEPPSDYFKFTTYHTMGQSKFTPKGRK
jgi:ABC-type transporter Mla subunit MlaD